MKRPRPHIPYSVRVVVLAKQMLDAGHNVSAIPRMDGESLPELTARWIAVLFGADAKVHLDHDPPLRARTFNHRTGIYTPDANDPIFLIYRTDEDHRRKTNLRGDGAQYPDRVLIKRERRREKREAGITKRRKKIPQRKSAWPKGRKIPKRPNAWGR